MPGFFGLVVFSVRALLIFVFLLVWCFGALVCLFSNPLRHLGIIFSSLLCPHAASSTSCLGGRGLGPPDHAQSLETCGSFKKVCLFLRLPKVVSGKSASVPRGFRFGGFPNPGKVEVGCRGVLGVFGKSAPKV